MAKAAIQKVPSNPIAPRLIAERGPTRRSTLPQARRSTATGQIRVSDSNFDAAFNLCCLPLSRECDKLSRAYKLVVMD